MSLLHTCKYNNKIITKFKRDINKNTSFTFGKVNKFRAKIKLLKFTKEEIFSSFTKRILCKIYFVGLAFITFPPLA